MIESVWSTRVAHCGHRTSKFVRSPLPSVGYDIIFCPDCAEALGENGVIETWPRVPPIEGAGADNGGIYVQVITGLASPGGTLILLKTSSAVPVEIIKARVSETASVTSTKVPVQLVTWGTAPLTAGMNAGTITLLNPGEHAVVSSTWTWKTGQTDGTTATYLDADAANFLAPWAPQDQPDFRILIAVSSNVTLYAPSAPAGTYSAVLGWREVV